MISRLTPLSAIKASSGRSGAEGSASMAEAEAMTAGGNDLMAVTMRTREYSVK